MHDIEERLSIYCKHFSLFWACKCRMLESNWLWCPWNLHINFTFLLSNDRLLIGGFENPTRLTYKINKYK